MRVSEKADMAEYLEAVAESMALRAETDAEVLAAVFSRERYRAGEIDASRFRDEAGEASIRASRVKAGLSEARDRWSGLVAETGPFPPLLSAALEENVHRLRSACSRLEELEREALAEADRHAEELARRRSAKGSGAGLEETE